MAIELKVPSAGESITEVTVVEWLKSEGAKVDRDEAIALLETDKANLELLAPVPGQVSRILKKAGETAKVGEVIGIFDAADASEAKDAAPASTRTPRDESKQVEPRPRAEEPRRTLEAPRPSTEGAPQSAKVQQAGAASRSAPQPGAEARASIADGAPGTRDAAQDGEEADDDNGTKGGPGAQIRPRTPAARRALRESLQHGPAAGVRGVSEANRTVAIGVPPPHAAPRAQPAAPPQTVPTPRPAAESRAPVADDRRQEVVPMTPLRRRVAERLVEAQHAAALLTTFNEIDLAQVIALRKQHQEAFTQKHGIKLGFMSFFVRAAIDALRAFPGINAEIRGTDIVYHHYYDIGVAIGGGKGLVVPVIRNAERLGFAEIERAIADFGERAKQSRLTVSELQGGTFTISNGGIYGSMMSTPIINPPQSGILGMHAIQERAVVRSGAVVIAPMMYVALTYDHRIVDGREAVSFLVRVKEHIESPTRMLLDV